jgi:CRP/FNR family cyclic AMP-dependent transcriptional regulator
MVNIRHIKKGDVLVREGESSNSMYWVQAGTLRLYKKKGTGFIELGVVHSGEVVGELSFLDNQPRSASVEALQPCDIIEIPRGKFDEFLTQQPSWMKSLVQTLVKRLRTTNNRVKELESSSTVYAKEEGRTVKQHEFISDNEALRLCAAVMLGAVRYGEKQGDGSIKVKAGVIQLFGGNIANIHVSKVTTFLEVMQDAGLLKIDKQKDHVDVYILNLDRIEKYVMWLNDETSKPDEKQLQISDKAMVILNAIQEYGNLPKVATGEHSVNVEAVFQKLAAAKNVKFPFEWSSYEEIVKAGLSKEVRMASPTEKLAVLNMEVYAKLYPHLALRQKFRDLNAQKRAANA